MQDKIKEILSLPKEEADEKYHEFLQELYEAPVLWTVLHRDLSDIGAAMGNPVIMIQTPPEKNATPIKIVRLFTQYHYAVDFCDKHPEFTYQGIPLIARLEKDKNDFNYFFSIAPHMQVQRIWLDDCSIAQVFNFRLMDFIEENDINTKISCMIYGPAQPSFSLRFNMEYFDMFSFEMCNHIINPIISTYFSNDKKIACNYLEKAPLLYVLFLCGWFSHLIANPEWLKDHEKDVPGAEEFIAYSKKLLVKRVYEQSHESDMLCFFLLEDNSRYLTLGDATVGMAVNDIGLKSYAKVVGESNKCDVKTYNVQPKQLLSMLQICEAGGIKNIRFMMPLKDSVNVLMSIEGIRNIVRKIEEK